MGENKKYLSTVLEIVAAAVLGVLAVLPLNELFAAFSLYQTLAVVLLAFVGSMYIHMLMHELGHMIFGRLSGYEFLAFRLGSFAILRSENQLVLRRIGSMGTGGQCLMIPPEGEDTRCPYVLYNFGGSLMNLILGVICMPMYFIWSSLPGSVLYIFGLTGIFYFLMNWVPLKIGGIPNDGYNSLTCSRSDESRRAFCLALRIAGQLYSGIRLRDIDSSWFELSENAGGDPLTACHMCFCASRYMDLGDISSARELFERVVLSSGIDEINRKEASCELLYIAVLEDSEKIDELYTKELRKYIKSFSESTAAKRCSLARALASGADAEKLDSIRKSLRKCIDKYAVGATSQMEEDWASSLEEKYSAHTEN